LDMALHLAINAPWHDHETTQTGILYIAGEGVRGIAKRVSAWLHHYGLQDIKALPIRFLPHAIDFLDLGDVRKLARTIEHLIGAAETPIGLVVIDTVARNMNGNENDAVDMNRLVSACDELRKKFSLSVIGVHHAGKDSERGMRGSTVLPGGSDTIIEVKRTENVMCVTCRKQKDDEEFATLYMEMIKATTDHFDIRRD
jgi:RecA-family ATPase